jgi:hypothetical protein
MPSRIVLVGSSKDQPVAVLVDQELIEVAREFRREGAALEHFQRDAPCISHKVRWPGRFLASTPNGASR